MLRKWHTIYSILTASRHFLPIVEICHAYKLSHPAGFHGSFHLLFVTSFRWDGNTCMFFKHRNIFFACSTYTHSAPVYEKNLAAALVIAFNLKQENRVVTESMHKTWHSIQCNGVKLYINCTPNYSHQGQMGCRRYLGLASLVRSPTNISLRWE